MTRKPTILVVGSINMDLLLMTERLPLPGESMLSEKYVFGPGGKGANQAVACAKMGADTTFVCKTGEDAFGAQLKETLAKNGVDTEFVSVNKGGQSGFAVILLEGEGSNRIIAHLASNLDLNEADIDRAFARDYDGMVVQFEIPAPMVIYACEQAKKKGIPIIVDAGPAIDLALERIQGTEIISPNETETAALVGIFPDTEAECLEAARRLARRSLAKYVVLKRGEKGAALYKDDKITFFPPHKVTAVDATAAGDVFTAALAVRYFGSGNLVEAIEFANAAGALAVTKAGAQASIPSPEAVTGMLTG